MPKTLGDRMRDLRNVEDLSLQLIDKAREPMRRAIGEWLYTWSYHIPPNAAKQLREIRDGEPVSEGDPFRE